MQIVNADGIASSTLLRGDWRAKVAAAVAVAGMPLPRGSTKYVAYEVYERQRFDLMTFQWRHDAILVR
jgi:hypothetical protein